MNREYMCYCGFYCENCAVKVKVEPASKVLFKEMKNAGFEDVIHLLPDGDKFWSFLKGMATDGVCVSCKAGSGDPNCAIRKCATEKGVEMCALCESYPCELFNQYFGDYPMLLNDNAVLREKGIDEWAKIQNERKAKGFTYPAKDECENLRDFTQVANNEIMPPTSCAAQVEQKTSQMNKSKTSKPVEKFFRELIVVVLGIAITVGAGLWINHNNNKKDLKLYMDAIIMELDENIEYLEWFTKWMQKSVRYADYISSHDEKSLNRDTINYYREINENGIGIHYFVNFFNFQTNSFEVFKNSGIMRQVNDKEILRLIWKAYDSMVVAKNFIDMYFQIKREEVMKEAQFLAEGKPIAVPMQSFYTIGLPIAMLHICTETSELLKEIVLKLKE